MITTPRMAAAATLAAALACMIGLYVGALMINAGAYNDRDPFRLGAGISTFALLFVLALAVERVVQPISPILGPNTEVVKAQVKNAQVDGKIAEEEAKEKMGRCTRQDRDRDLGIRPQVSPPSRPLA